MFISHVIFWNQRIKNTLNNNNKTKMKKKIVKTFTQWTLKKIYEIECNVIATMRLTFKNERTDWDLKLTIFSVNPT